MYGYQPPNGRQLAATTRRLLRHVAQVKAAWDERDAQRRRDREQARRWAEVVASQAPTVGWRGPDDEPYQKSDQFLVTREDGRLVTRRIG